MKKKILIVVDMQNDFIDGPLQTDEAKKITSAVINRINQFDGDIFLTQDTHNEDYLDTLEGKHLPIKHCVIDTEGWQIQKDVRFAAEKRNSIIFQKHTFGSIELAKNIIKY